MTPYKTYYQKKSVPNILDITTSVTNCVVFGVEIEILIIVYNWHDKRSSVNLFIREAEDNVLGYGIRDGFLRISQKNRVLEQKISLPRLNCALLNPSILTGAMNGEGRETAAYFIKILSNAFEKIRQSVVYNLSSGIAIDWINQVYGKITDKVKNFCNDINWKFLFPNSHCGPEFIQVLDYALTHNPIEIKKITDEIDDTVLSFNQAVQYSCDIAHMKASSLLNQVIGVEAMNFFIKHNYFILHSFGYEFVFAPNKWIKCTDRNGKTAQLCIHTKSFSCHPLDEVVIAYLHLKHRETFVEFMKTAILHHDKGIERYPQEFVC